MTIYVDKENRCHLQNDGTMSPVQTDFFAGKCQRFVEGYRYVPPGETWIRADGVEFTGEMLSPCKNYALLSAAQQGYETLLPRLKELHEKFEAISECFEGLATNPSFEQLVDLIRAIRELIED